MHPTLWIHTRTCLPLVRTGIMKISFGLWDSWNLLPLLSGRILGQTFDVWDSFKKHLWDFISSCFLISLYFLITSLRLLLPIETITTSLYYSLVNFQVLQNYTSEKHSKNQVSNFALSSSLKKWSYFYGSLSLSLSHIWLWLYCPCSTDIQSSEECDSVCCCMPSLLV